MQNDTKHHCNLPNSRVSAYLCPFYYGWPPSSMSCVLYIIFQYKNAVVVLIRCPPVRVSYISCLTYSQTAKKNSISMHFEVTNNVPVTRQFEQMSLLALQHEFGVFMYSELDYSQFSICSEIRVLSYQFSYLSYICSHVLGIFCCRI